MHTLSQDASHELDRDEERALATSVTRGDRAALDRLHALLSEPVYRFVFYRMRGEVQETEEIVQETFLETIRSLHRFRAESSLFTWTCGIAKNLIARSRRRRYRDRLATALEAADPELDEMLARLDDTVLPDEVLEREETQDLVGATMASLPLPYQEVLTEKYLRHRAVNEIARRKRTSPKAIESMLTRARVAFRKAFELLAGHLPKGGKP